MAIASSDKLVVVKAFAPSNPLPLDAREIHDSLAEARAYAATSAIAYAGQTIKVVENGVVTVYTLAPSEAEGVNFELQFVGGGGSGIQGVAASNTAGNITVTTVEGDHAVTKDVPVVGAFVDVTVAADGEKSEATTFTYKDAANADQTKVVYATGIRKVEAGTTGGKLKVTNAATDGVMTTSEIVIGAGSVMNPAYDADSRKITLPVMQADGTTQDLEIALGKDMVVTSGTYNEETHEIELTLTDGTIVKIPAAELVDVYTGIATATVIVTVSSDNKISAAVKISTVEGNLLKTDENGLYVSEADFTATKQLISDAESAAKAHADQKVAAEVTARDEAIATAKGEANEYTDTAKESAIASANTYTDGKIAGEVTARDAAITAAKEELTGYIDEEVAGAEAAAKAHADEKVADEAEARGTAITAAVEEAKGYTDEQVGAATTAANGYVDQKMAAEVTARDAAIATAKGEANTYTDEQVAAEATARGTAITNAINAEVTARDAAIATAKGEANSYTDEQVAAEAAARGTAITNAINAEVTARDEAIGTAKDEANAYTDKQVADATTAANGYVDEKIGAEETARNEAIEEAVAAEAAARGTAITNAVAAEATARDEAIATAKDEANDYTDEQVAAEATARGTAITNAVSAEATARDAAIATAKGEATDYTDEQVEGCLTAAKAYADQIGESAGVVTWVDFGA